MEQFLLVNLARSRNTRRQRATNPTHKGLVQKLDGGVRVLRGRPTVISKERLLAIMEDVSARQKVGILEVRSMDGRRVNFEEGEFKVAPLPPAPPIPHWDRDRGYRVDEMGKEQFEHSEAANIGPLPGKDFELPETIIAGRAPLDTHAVEDDLDLPPSPLPNPMLAALDDVDDLEEEVDDETAGEPDPASSPGEAPKKARKNRRRH